MEGALVKHDAAGLVSCILQTQSAVCVGYAPPPNQWTI